MPKHLITSAKLAGWYGVPAATGGWTGAPANTTKRIPFGAVTLDSASSAVGVDWVNDGSGNGQWSATEAGLFVFTLSASVSAAAAAGLMEATIFPNSGYASANGYANSLTPLVPVGDGSFNGYGFTTSAPWQLGIGDVVIPRLHLFSPNTATDFVLTGLTLARVGLGATRLG